MGVWTLFVVASMPIVQMLLVSIIGAIMATEHFNLLSDDTRKSLNKIVFVAFTPCLIFACLAESVTFHDIISWWFMPVNIGITFLCGGTLGWIAVKLIRPEPHMEGLIIAMCSTGNLGNILLIIVPAICTQSGSPFGDHAVCKANGLSYSSFSMALGCFYIWTYTYQLIRSSAAKYNAMKEAEDLAREPNKDLDANETGRLLNKEGREPVSYVTSMDPENQTMVYQESANKERNGGSSWSRLKENLQKILDELLAPPTIGAIAGFIFGAVPSLKSLIIGVDAPLRVIQDSITLLGDGTIPCITLILGGNLIQGLRNATIRPIIIVTIIVVRYVILPVIGIGVIKVAGDLGILPSDPLFSFVLMIQFLVPPAMNISTMTQLFNVGQAECSVLTMWTYIAAIFALTGWSTDMRIRKIGDTSSERMGFWGLFEVASMPILQVLIVSAVGAIMATDYLNLLPTNTINSLNKIVFVIFTPSLIFASLVETVTFEDIISWWFMPINIGLTFLFGGILGWIAIKLIKPKPHLEGLIMAMCSTGNFANLLLIMVPAICTDDGSPFGDHSVCKAKGLSYASFSMALGSFYTWTCTYQLIQGSALRFNSMKETEKLLNEANKDLDANQNTRLLSREDHDNIDRIIPSSNLTSNDTENQRIAYEGSIGNEAEKDGPFSDRLVEILKKLVEQLLAPPTIGSFAGLVFGAIPWVKSLLVGEKAPLRALQDSITDGTIPCLTLILGGNLTKGLRKANVGPTIIMTVIVVRYLILPIIGIGVIKMAATLGLLPLDPLFRFVLLIMFALPPGTMAQLFSVGQEECAMLMMWTYLAAAFALTTWSTIYMWILS
ncbi:hypothetical protein OSB04_000600 [Centaurea solstitialis]|uniref:Uncharacterized protein n=1 Tax=Centaurea solstitialis TaxID=347529 RepID=A0AA38WTY2_9ASTR|nr:hypothetical protein OSB04_000600 [Centaurea solstitialis]